MHLKIIWLVNIKLRVLETRLLMIDLQGFVATRTEGRGRAAAISRAQGPLDNCMLAGTYVPLLPTRHRTAEAAFASIQCTGIHPYYALTKVDGRTPGIEPTSPHVKSYSWRSTLPPSAGSLHSPTVPGRTSLDPSLGTEEGARGALSFSGCAVPALVHFFPCWMDGSWTDVWKMMGSQMQPGD